MAGPGYTEAAGSGWFRSTSTSGFAAVGCYHIIYPRSFSMASFVWN